MRSVPRSIYDSQYYFKVVEGGDSFLMGEIHKRFYEVLGFADIQPGDSVLDLGTGRGEMAVLCAREEAQVWSIDYSPESIKIAKEFISKNLSQNEAKNVDLEVMNAKKLEFKNESFDRVIFLETLEHLYPEEVDAVFSEIKRVLKPGGKLILSTGPNAFLIKPVLFLGTLLTGRRTWESRKYHVNEQNFFNLKKLLTSYGFSTSIKIGHSRNWLYGQISEQGISERVKALAKAVNRIYDCKIFYAIRRLPLLDIFLGTHFLCSCIKPEVEIDK